MQAMNALNVDMVLSDDNILITLSIIGFCWIGCAT